MLPVLVLSAIAVRAVMGSPIFFRQQRPGLKGKPFYIIKFRSMRGPKPGEIWFRSDKDRLTPVGRFLRRTSIDELPELWNVLRGEMSLVGPRPLLMEYLGKYTAEANRRHDVCPGITGLAQVYGRQHLLFSERLKLDVWYVDKWSLLLDINILCKTVFSVLFSKGIVSGQNVDSIDDLGLSSDKPSRK